MKDYNNEICLNFLIPDSYKNLCPKSYYLIKENIELLKERVENKDKNYEFINKINNTDTDINLKSEFYYDLIKLVKFYEKAIEEKEYNKLILEDKVLIYKGLKNIICPITNKEIIENDEVYLLFFKKEDSILFYIIKKENFYKLVKFKYLEELDFEIEDKHIPTELILQRWQERIYTERKERNEYKKLIKEVLDYYSELNNKISISLI